MRFVLEMSQVIKHGALTLPRPPPSFHIIELHTNIVVRAVKVVVMHACYYGLCFEAYFTVEFSSGVSKFYENSEGISAIINNAYIKKVKEMYVEVF